MAEAAGGPPVVVRRLVEGAQAEGWETEVITCPDYCEDGGKQLQADAGICVLPSKFSGLFGSGRAKLKNSIQSADLVHCHTLWSPLVTGSAALARKLQTPYVVSPHGMLDPYSLAQKKLKKRLYLEAFERQTIASASFVLLTAEKEQHLAELTFGPITNAAVVPLGADRLIEERNTLQDYFHTAHPDLLGKRVLLFMGRLHPKKRPDVLLDVMKAISDDFPDARLLFAGTGAEVYVSHLKDRARNLCLDNRVLFLGHLSGIAKASALAAADMFLLPSHQENFGIAVAEALHAGLPVILTRNVNIWQEIAEADAGIAVEDEDVVRTFSEATCSLLTNLDKLKAMSTNASLLAERYFTWERSSAMTLAIYETALGQS